MSSLALIILAAGKGTRMRSKLPKVMHKLAGRPMIAHAISAALPLEPEKAVVVIAPEMEKVEKAALAAFPGCRFAVQQEQLGTGHAVKCGMEKLQDFSGDALVIYGDTPLLTPETLSHLMRRKREERAAIALLGMQPEDPTGYGRLVMNEPPLVDRIVECKDASAEEKRIPWVWGGVMAFDDAFLSAGLAKLTPSPATKEYYLTELIRMASAEGLKSLMVPVAEEETRGVNTRAEQAAAEAVLQARLRAKAMKLGATLVAPETVFFSADTVLASDVIVHPFVTFGPGVSVGEGTEIRSFCHLEGAEIGEGATIGPFARLRPGTQLGQDAHVGNFVELKNSHLARGAKVNHLSYVGDAEVGEAANVGAGTITCNYDGKAKHKTVIGARAFIGSNAALVAPVSVGEGAIVGAGSVITENVPAETLALARGRQVNKERKRK